MTEPGRFRVSSRIGVVMIAALATIALTFSGTPRGSLASEEEGPKACSIPVAKQGIRQFIRAYNRGNTEKLDRLFTEEEIFGWYSIGPPGLRKGNVAHRRAGLMRYFENRHSRHDRFYLRRFDGRKGHGYPHFESATHFGLLLGRRADGFNRGRWFRIGGKGALVCDGNQPRIFVMSLGAPRWLFP